MKKKNFKFTKKFIIKERSTNHLKKKRNIYLKKKSILKTKKKEKNIHLKNK